MGLVTLADLRAHLSLTEGVAEEDDAMLEAFAAAAEALIEAELGFSISERYAEEDSPPAPLRVAVLQLAAFWYEHRLAAAPEDLRVAPFATRAIVDAYRDRSF